MVATLTLLPFIITGAIGGLAALDFLGLGLPPSYPSLGELALQGKNRLQRPLARLHRLLHLRHHAVAARLHLRGRPRRLRPAKDLPVTPPTPRAPASSGGRCRAGAPGRHGGYPPRPQDARPMKDTGKLPCPSRASRPRPRRRFIRAARPTRSRRQLRAPRRRDAGASSARAAPASPSPPSRPSACCPTTPTSPARSATAAPRC